MKRAVLTVAALALVYGAGQVPAGEIHGTWYGLVTFQTETWNEQAQPIYSSGSYFADMSLSYTTKNNILNYIIGDYEIIGSAAYPGITFGPTSASGSAEGNIYPGPAYGDLIAHGIFDVNYQSILPDGSIDTSNGSAEGSMYIPFGHPGYPQASITNVSFGTVPEPSSVALAATALLMIGLLSWSRRLHEATRGRGA
jgi:hypothetical protein